MCVWVTLLHRLVNTPKRGSPAPIPAARAPLSPPLIITSGAKASPVSHNNDYLLMTD
jgi:hypothetical protein